MKKSKRIFGLDVLRAIAITLVVVSHTTYLLFSETEHVLITLIRAMGAVGVDLFFVLSGFLIGGILLKKTQNNTTNFSDLILFFKRRWLRTLPNYFVVLLLNIIVFLIVRGSLPESIASYFVFLQNFTTPHPNFFTEAWSLSIEEYAYVLLPILLYVFLALFPKKEKSKLFLYTTVATILGLLLLKINYYLNTGVVDYKQWSATFRKVVIYRLDSIYMGFLVVYFYRKHIYFWSKNRNKFAILGMLFFIGLHLFIQQTKATPQTHLSFYVFVYLQGVVVSLACLFPYAIALKSNAQIKQIIEYISTRSYAIYLINYSIVLLTVAHFFKDSVTPLQKLTSVLVYLVVAILLTEILYRFIEQPILRYRDKKQK